MTLLDCISQIDENTKRVNVFLNDELATYYDGKNSIDEFYNNFPVVCCSYHEDENAYYIDIDGELFMCPCCGVLETAENMTEIDGLITCHHCGETSKETDFIRYI